MNFIAVFYACSWIILFVGVAIAAAVPVGYFCGDSIEQLKMLSFSAIIPIVCGILLALITYKRKRTYTIRDGFGTVAMSWLVAGIFGALPYMFVEHFFWYDALFETMSGYSTTGASIIDPTTQLTNGAALPLGIESLSKGILFWRATTHFLGGMGFVVLSVAILPFLGLGTQFMFSAESSAGARSNQLATRIASASKVLWGVYVMLTVILTVLLKTAGMDWFDAVCHSFSTMATGGFSTKQASIAAYNDSIAIVITVFMFIAATNFILHARAIRGQIFNYIKDEEFRAYIMMIFFVSLISMVAIYFYQDTMMLVTGEKIPVNIKNLCQHVTFTVSSLISSTGFATVDYAIWPPITILPLLILLFVGGCAGSTTGGMKQIRLVLVIKHMMNQVKQCLFPHAKPNIRFCASHVDISIVNKALGFFTFYICFSIFIGFLVMILSIFDPEVERYMNVSTAMTISITSLSNIGPGLGHISPMYTMAWLSPIIKILLSFVMVIGRLEVFTILVLFLPSFWRK